MPCWETLKVSEKKGTPESESGAAWAAASPSVCRDLLEHAPVGSMQARSRVCVHEGQAQGCQCAGLSVWGGPAPPHLGDPDYNLESLCHHPLGLPSPICVPALIPGSLTSAPGVSVPGRTFRAALSMPTGPSANWLRMAEVTRGPGLPDCPHWLLRPPSEHHLPGHTLIHSRNNYFCPFPATALPAQASSGREKAVCSVAERFLWGWLWPKLR